MSGAGQLTQGALDELSDEEMLNGLTVDTVHSLRDIEALYGGLLALATADGGPYARYLTPRAGQDWLGDDDRVVAIRVDLTTAREHPANATYEGIHVAAYTRELVSSLGHSKYPPGQGIDHSITHQTGSCDGKKKIPDFAIGRLTNWPNQDSVAELAINEEFNDGWMLTALAQLGETEEIQDAIREDITEQLSRDGDVFTTVQVRLEEDGEWLWPGDVVGFQEAMTNLRQERLSTKNLTSSADPAVGDGVCLVTGNATEVVGTADDPFKAYLTKQWEKFPGFTLSDSWMTHPISVEAALDVAAAQPFLNACQVSAFRGMVFHLPYFPGPITAEQTRILYYTLVDLVKNTASGNAPTARALENAGDYSSELRFYTLVVHRQDKERYNVLGEATSTNTVPLADVATAHDTLSQSKWFGTGDGATFYAGGKFFNPTQKTIDAVASGQYLWMTLPDRERNNTSNADIRPDDPRVKVFTNLADGTPIAYDQLVSWYVERLVDEEGSGEDEGFPRWNVVTQFAQLCTLQNAGLITARDGTPQPTLPVQEESSASNTPRNIMSDMNANQSAEETPSEAGADVSARDRREVNLTEFIASHPPLRDDHERRGAFLLGALIGNVSRIQQQKGVSRTVADSYSIAGLSKHSLARAATNVLHKNEVYASEEGYNEMFGELTKRLSDTLQQSQPEEWTLTTDALRFHYALGIAYGKNAGGTGSDTEDSKDDSQTN